jgi:hypothetical protein
VTLFFCQWEDRNALLVDATDREDAAFVASKVADGDAPTRVLPLAPRAFVAEVFIPDEDDAEAGELEGVLVVDPLDHVRAMLEELDDQDVTAAPTVPAESEAKEECGAEAEGEEPEAVLVCNLPKKHDGKHTAGGYEW